MKETIRFFAHGIPKGQPRPKAFSRGGRAGVYDPGTAEGWKGQVALAAKDKRPQEPWDGPIEMILEFRFPRPKWHYGTGKNSGAVKWSSPMYVTGKPDSDNLAKAVLDAMTQLGFWRDDAQVARISIVKYYTTFQPGCDILLGKL